MRIKDLKECGKTILSNFIVPLIVPVLIVFIIFLMFSCADNVVWDNGKCSCGGNWVYDRPIGHAYSTYYIYRCDKCSKVHEFWFYRQDLVNENIEIVND